ncbi:MAG: hypothetical protein ISS33_04655 [Candidatus Omnitrophica bacterium]|nr:hypothetical protein [Candidatus Omnitrophota bacterium]
MNLAGIGLILVAVAWIVQLAFSWKGNKSIRPLFIIVYMAGVLLLVIADYLQTNVLSYFELLTLIAAGIVLWKILKKG